MTKELLPAVKERLEAAEIPYQYETYQTAEKLPPVYCVGHCSSSPVTEESGMMCLTLTTLWKWEMDHSWKSICGTREVRHSENGNGITGNAYPGGCRSD